MNRFQITRTGTYLTVQDWGRFHYQHLGVSPSGIMDQRIPSFSQGHSPSSKSIFRICLCGSLIESRTGAIKVSVGGQCNIFVQKIIILKLNMHLIQY